MPIRYGATRSPTFHSSETPAPALTIVPASSSPMISGNSSGKREMPSRKSTSRWLSAQAPTLTSDLARPCDRVGHGLDDELVAPAELMDSHCLHVASRERNRSDDCSPRPRAWASTAALIEMHGHAASALAPIQAAVRRRGRPPGRAAAETTAPANTTRSARPETRPMRPLGADSATSVM